MSGVVATWDEMRNAQAGQDMGTFPKNVARAAKDVLCAVNSLYPEWMVEGGVGGLVGSPLVRDLCRRVPPNAPGERNLPFQGGQCNTVYEFQGTVTVTQANGSTATSADSSWRSGTRGPITAKFIEFAGPQVNGNYTVNGGFIGAGGARARIANVPGATYVSDNLQMRRADLQPDNCGNPPTRPPATPPIGDIMRPVPIPVPGGPAVILPVVIPVGVLFKPTLQVNVGDINVNFDAGGVTFSPTVNINPVRNRTIEPQPTTPPVAPLPPTRPPAKDDDDKPCPPCPDVNLKPVTDRLDKMVKYVRRPKTFLELQALGGGGSGVFTLPARTRFVTVAVTVLPPNKREQSGGPSGPNAYHQGWCAVGRSGAFGERIPLSYLQNVYPVPVECDTFSFTLYNGGVANVSAWVEKDRQECQEYECG